MRLFGKETRDLNQDDIDRLIQNQVVESRVLDYKLNLPKPNDAGKKELLADITAMANTDGGLLIFGIKEAQEEGRNAGYPGEIIGLNGTEGTELNIEQLKQWLDSVIRDGIEPRLNGIEFHEIRYFEKVLFIIDISRSLQSPHMVKFGGDSRFYARSNTGKYQMDVRQIREAFSLTNQWRSSAESFRKNRLESYHETIPGISTSEAAVLFQVLPLGERDLIDLKGKANEVARILPSVSDTGYSPGYNLDGIIKRSGEGNGYIQIFRNGGLEAFEFLNYSGKDPQGQWRLYLERITSLSMKHLHYYLKFTEQYHIYPPFVVYINIINMSGAYVRLGTMGGITQFANGREQLLLPGIYIDDANVDINHVLRSSFDMIYQSCGSAQCPSYTTDGIFNLDYIEN